MQGVVKKLCEWKLRELSGEVNEGRSKDFVSVELE
jgi:hypothetical protein